MVLAFIMILAHVRKQAPSLQPPAAQTTSPAANAPELGSKAAPGVGPDTTLVITDVQVGRVKGLSLGKGGREHRWMSPGQMSEGAFLTTNEAEPDDAAGGPFNNSRPPD